MIRSTTSVKAALILLLFCGSYQSAKCINPIDDCSTKSINIVNLGCTTSTSSSTNCGSTCFGAVLDYHQSCSSASTATAFQQGIN